MSISSGFAFLIIVVAFVILGYCMGAGQNVIPFLATPGDYVSFFMSCLPALAMLAVVFVFQIGLFLAIGAAGCFLWFLISRVLPTTWSAFVAFALILLVAAALFGVDDLGWRGPLYEQQVLIEQQAYRTAFRILGYANVPDDILAIRSPFGFPFPYFIYASGGLMIALGLAFGSVDHLLKEHRRKTTGSAEKQVDDVVVDDANQPVFGEKLSAPASDSEKKSELEPFYGLLTIPLAMLALSLVITGAAIKGSLDAGYSAKLALAHSDGKCEAVQVYASLERGVLVRTEAGPVLVMWDDVSNLSGGRCATASSN